MSAVDFDGCRTIGDAVALAGANFGDKTAYVQSDGRTRSFSAIATNSGRLGQALRASGLAAGDRIAILSKNRVEIIEAIFAGVAGLIPVPLNWRLAPRELALVLEDCAPRAILADEGHAGIAEHLARGLVQPPLLLALDHPRPGWRAYDEVIAEGATARGEPTAQNADLPACLLYTSGTTGRPKGVELTHRGLLRNAAVARTHMLGLTEADRGLTAMPLFHVGGLWYHAVPTFFAGNTMSLLSEFKVDDVLRTLASSRATHMHLVPTMLHALLDHPELDRYDVSALRLVFYAASAIPVDLLRRATVRLGHCDFVQGYGSTEAGMVTALTPADHRRADREPQILLTCGRPLPGVAVRIAPMPGETSETGEVQVSSAMTMNGYRGNPSATAAAHEDGWLCTGDIGRLDAEGYLTILDRKNDMIVTGGENVFPREVEDALLADPDVAEACVFGVCDDRWVQRVVAAIVAREGAAQDGEALVRRLRARLAAYKCPKQIHFVGALPKSGAGKVLRRDLRLQYGPRDAKE